jgi:NAD-dependent DNA ligase
LNLEGHGWRPAVVGGRSKQTRCMQAGEESGFKRDKAKEADVSVIDEAAFLKMLQG